MPADKNDYVQLPAVLVTQVTPWNYSAAGVLCSAAGNLTSAGGSGGSTYIETPVTIALATNSGGASGTYQLATQDNTTPGGIINVPWLTTVAYSQAEAGLFKPVNGILRS